MKNIFIDTNVVIDFLANREPFSLAAATLFDLGVTGRTRLYISAVSYNNIYYILRRSLSHTAAISLLEELAEITEIADVTASIIKLSLKSDFKDYEDAIQYYCALSLPDIDCIVTRNTKDFKKSTLAVLTPTEALASFQSFL